ncbi:MAG TPA: hypothetical protein EYP67_02870, partial [Methanosarcinales archaeon]|nr:hypothetical protein [Methanosarcinales archaeon]
MRFYHGLYYRGTVKLEVIMNDRVPTGIPGFDELCESGLVRNRTYLLSGTSGTGKTNFAFQFL